MGFPTYLGTVHLESSDEAMTPFGGLVPWAAFQKKAGVFEALVRDCPVTRTSPNASPIYDILCSFALTCLCDGARFAHVNRLRQDPTLCDLFGTRSIVSDDTIRRFFRTVPTSQSGEWIAAATRPLWSSLPDNFIQDWDSTVQTRYGKQEDAEVGYNPHKRGRASHHPLLAVIAGTRLCPYYRWRSGKAVSSSQWVEAAEECERWIGKQPWLNRGDIGFAQESILSWHEAPGRPHYLFKLRLTNNLKRAIARVGEDQWQGCPSAGVLQTAEITLQLQGWSQERRVVVGRRMLGHCGGPEQGEFWKVAKYEYEAYVTDFSAEEAESWQVIELYRARGDCENVFDELKNQWGFNGFTSRFREVGELAARLLLVVYNLWNLFVRLLEPNRHVEARHGRRWFLCIAARLVKSGRQRTWKMAVSGEWWTALREGYERVLRWLALTAPQLESIRAHSPPPDAQIVHI